MNEIINSLPLSLAFILTSIIGCGYFLYLALTKNIKLTPFFLTCSLSILLLGVGVLSIGLSNVLFVKPINNILAAQQTTNETLNPSHSQITIK